METFFQRLKVFHLNRTMMNKYILSTFVLNEAKPFVIIEPLNGTRHSFTKRTYLFKNFVV